MIIAKLNYPVLVLNKNWQAIRIIRAKRAICVSCRGRASLLSNIDDDWSIYTWEEWLELPVGDNEFIKSAKRKIIIPSMMILTHYDKYKDVMNLNSKNIFLRDGSICQYTGKVLTDDERDIDHVKPLSKGGKNIWENMVTCSISINRQKDNRTPKEAGLELIREPFKPVGNSFIIDGRREIPDKWKKFISVGGKKGK